MQKNNCKLKTIFKKGLSFSIALALGAAATSLNLARTASAASASVADGRPVYLLGETVSFDKLDGSAWSVPAVGYSSDNGASYVAVATPYTLTTTGSVTLKTSQTANALSEGADYTFKVYDWSKIYSGAEVSVAHGTNHDSAREAIVDALTFNLGSSAAAAVGNLAALLKKGELELSSDSSKIDPIDYAKHNGQEVQIKVNGVVCKLGKLSVNRDAQLKSIELVSAPTKYFYVAGGKIDYTGLKIKANYNVGDSEEIAWDETTSSKFTIQDSANNPVAQGADISVSYENMKVIYNNNSASATLTDAFSLYFGASRTLAAGTLGSLECIATPNTALTISALADSAANYKTLLSAFADDATILRAYDVDVTNGQVYLENSLMYLKLFVGLNYAGQTVTAKHLVGDEVQTWVETVDKDGYVTLGVNSLSPFMIALGATTEDEKEAEETEKKIDEATKNDTTAKDSSGSAASGTSASTSSASGSSKSGSSSVKTGDATFVGFSVCGLVALISAAVLAFLKKQRNLFEK